jgi:4,5:9,10-diseco-3-hydroxy-5,9,17-trioxoandrosta-1(10),2-diene-4-oate hydrolase
MGFALHLGLLANLWRARARVNGLAARLENRRTMVQARDMDDRYLQAGAVRVRYWAAGDQGAPLVLLHGLGASVECWQENLAELGERYRVFAVDAPGFGRSDKPDRPLTIDYLAAFVRDFLDALALPRATLIGHSLGGAVALRFALDSPGRIDRLVLVAPAALGRRGSLALRLMTLPGVGELFSRPSRAGTARFIRMASSDPSVVTDELVDRAYELARLPGAQASLLSALRAAVTLGGQRRECFGPIVDGLRQIAAPTLVLWGTKDRILPVAQAEVTRAIADVRVERWTGCGHLPMMERPAEFNTLVLDFLARSKAAAA